MKILNKNIRILWGLTIITLLVAIIGIELFYLEIITIEELSGFSSIFTASGSLIAIIWFYNSLQQQSTQLEEQRKQFQLEFKNLRLEGKRSIIMLAQTLFNNMETKLTKKLKNNEQIENLPTLFMTKALPLLKPITESEDCKIVLKSCEEFNTMLTPIRFFLFSLKEIGILFLEHEDITVINDDNKPEWFIDTYKKQLSRMPLIKEYLSTAILLSILMIRVKLDAVNISNLTAYDLLYTKNDMSTILKTDKMKKSIESFKEKNKTLPKIAEVWLKTYIK